jgi:hypothetical protein
VARLRVASFDQLTPRQPLCLAVIALVHGIQNQFDPGRNAELLENAKQVLLDRVFAESQFLSNLTIGKSFRHQRYYLLLARCDKSLRSR